MNMMRAESRWLLDDEFVECKMETGTRLPGVAKEWAIRDPGWI